jgi:hypothetical protein
LAQFLSTAKKKEERKRYHYRPIQMSKAYTLTTPNAVKDVE